MENIKKTSYTDLNIDNAGDCGNTVINYCFGCPYMNVCLDCGYRCNTCGRRKKSYYIPEPCVFTYPWIYPFTWPLTGTTWISCNM